MTQPSIISPKILENPIWLADVTRADEWIREILGKFADSKSWEWEVKVDSAGRPNYDIRIVYEVSSISERFNRFEIGNKKLFTRRMTSAWGLLLDDVFAVDRRRFAETVREWNAEEAAVAN